MHAVYVILKNILMAGTDAFRLIPKTIREIVLVTTDNKKQQSDEFNLDHVNIQIDFMTVGRDMRKVLRQYDERYSKK